MCLLMSLCPIIKKPAVPLAEMTEYTCLGRTVGSLKAMDVKAAQAEKVPGGLQRLGNTHGFLKRYLV